MTEELVRLTNRNDEMEEMVKGIPKLKIQLKVQTIIVILYHANQKCFFMHSEDCKW